MSSEVSSRSPSTPALGVMRGILGALVALLLFAMMVLTFVDVVGRYFFNSPVQGSYELTEVLLAISVFAALPLATLSREHVTVELFDHFFRGGVRAVQQFIIGAVSAVVVSGLAWRLLEQARTLAEYDDRSLFLQIPYYLVAYFMTAMAVISALVIVGITVVVLVRVVNAKRGAA